MMSIEAIRNLIVIFLCSLKLRIRNCIVTLPFIPLSVFSNTQSTLETQEAYVKQRGPFSGYLDGKQKWR